MCLAANHFETLQLAECGRLLQKHPQWTNQVHLADNMRKELSNALSQITQQPIGTGQAIPYFELCNWTIHHRYKKPDQSNGTVQTTAITVWCDSIHLETLQQYLIDFIGRSPTLGHYIPTGRRYGITQEQLAQHFLAHNQFCDNIRCIKVTNCHPNVMFSTTHNLLQHIVSVKPTTPAHDKDTIFKAVEPGMKVATDGTCYFLTQLNHFSDAVQFIDKTFPDLYTQSPEYAANKDVIGNAMPARSGPAYIVQHMSALNTITESLGPISNKYSNNSRTGTNRSNRHPFVITFADKPPPKTFNRQPTYADKAKQGLQSADNQSVRSDGTQKADNLSLSSKGTVSEISTIITAFSTRMSVMEDRTLQLIKDQQEYQKKRDEEQQKKEEEQQKNNEALAEQLRLSREESRTNREFQSQMLQFMQSIMQQQHHPQPLHPNTNQPSPLTPLQHQATPTGNKVPPSATPPTATTNNHSQPSNTPEQHAQHVPQVQNTHLHVPPSSIDSSVPDADMSGASSNVGKFSEPILSIQSETYTQPDANETSLQRQLFREPDNQRDQPQNPVPTTPARPSQIEIPNTPHTTTSKMSWYDQQEAEEEEEAASAQDQSIQDPPSNQRLHAQYDQDPSQQWHQVGPYNRKAKNFSTSSIASPTRTGRGGGPQS